MHLAPAAGILDGVEWTRAGLTSAGFVGFVPFADLPTTEIPDRVGVYAVLRETPEAPAFLPRSTGGCFKHQDPTVPGDQLERAWVPDAHVVYIGKAGPRARGKQGLKVRLSEFYRFSAGKRIGHWGGRYLWQLADSSDLIVAWRETPDRDPKDVERELIDAFKADHHGVSPFANPLDGRRK